jgi:hypothetical protein
MGGMIFHLWLMSRGVFAGRDLGFDQVSYLR